MRSSSRAYEDAGGAPVDAEWVRFWEVFGNLRWGIICIQQARVYLDGRSNSVELAASAAGLQRPNGSSCSSWRSRETAVHDRPSVDELLRAVELLLDEQLVPALEGSRKYNARVATNVVRIVRRELAQEEQQLEAEWLGLDVLLGTMPRPPSLEVLRAAIRTRNAELSDRIAAGDADSGDWRALVLAHVRDTVHAKLEVSNPGWLEQPG